MRNIEIGLYFARSAEQGRSRTAVCIGGHQDRHPQSGKGHGLCEKACPTIEVSLASAAMHPPSRQTDARGDLIIEWLQGTGIVASDHRYRVSGVMQRIGFLHQPWIGRKIS